MTASDAQTDKPEVEGGDEAKQKLSLEVNIEKPSACERHITATIAREDVDRYLSDAVDELVPKAAVREGGGTSYVFVVKQDTVERRAVQVGGTDGDRLEVRAGLSGGDRVVVSPPDDLAEGRPIVVKGS